MFTFEQKPKPSQHTMPVNKTNVPLIVQDVISSPGQPLSHTSRTIMESCFGCDFRHVRVHADTQAAESARFVNALAYTIGSHIVFGKAQYTPETGRGHHMLAHELTHVVQQSQDTSEYLPDVIHSDHFLEQEAKAASRAVAHGNTFRPIQRGHRQLARLDDLWLYEMDWTPERPLPPQKPGPVEVTVIDDGDIVGWLAAFTRTGEVYMTSVHSMVENVLKAVGPRPISRLNILDHGNSNVIEIGNDDISPKTLPVYAPTLRRLQGHFAPNGFVHLQHCEVGQNLEFIKSLAAVFGVPVYAGTGNHNPIYRFNFGDYVRCDQVGACETKVSRP